MAEISKYLEISTILFLRTKSNADRSYQEQKNLDVLYAQIGDLLES